MRKEDLSEKSVKSRDSGLGNISTTPFLRQMKIKTSAMTTKIKDIGK